MCFAIFPGTGGGDSQCVCHGSGGIVRAAALQLRADRVNPSLERKLGARELPRKNQGQQGGEIFSQEPFHSILSLYGSAPLTCVLYYRTQGRGIADRVYVHDFYVSAHANSREMHTAVPESHTFV